ncbi:MAG TPA: glycosyl transferase family 1 [Actinobacteria bacterium]|nr:glycosyl transferase family 1 [Actinomycetota bacterium]
MRVLVAHNRYRSAVPSGENAVVDAETTALESAGVTVDYLMRDSDNIATMSAVQRATLAWSPVYARRAVEELRERVCSHRPDVLHVHNLYPLLSPALIAEAHDLGVPVVMTVHNFRLDCVAGTYLRDGRICTDCQGHNLATPALQHGCYRGSRAQSLPMVIARSVHRSTLHSIERYIALTPFHRDFLTQWGVESDRITVRPTSLADPGAPSPPGSDLVFVGRLGEEKGVGVLLDAWRQSSARDQGRKLHIIGDGDLRGLVDAAASADASIVVHGLQPAHEVARVMTDSAVVVIPSTCFEGLPVVLIEAMARGRAVIASDLGGLGATVNDTMGWPVTADDSASLAAALDGLTQAEVVTRGAAARERFTKEFSADVTLSQLTTVYEEVAAAGIRQ